MNNRTAWNCPGCKSKGRNVRWWSDPCVGSMSSAGTFTRYSDGSVYHHCLDSDCEYGYSMRRISVVPGDPEDQRKCWVRSCHSCRFYPVECSTSGRIHRCRKASLWEPCEYKCWRCGAMTNEKVMPVRIDRDGEWLNSGRGVLHFCNGQDGDTGIVLGKGLYVPDSAAALYPRRHIGSESKPDASAPVGGCGKPGHVQEGDPEIPGA